MHRNYVVEDLKLRRLEQKERKQERELEKRRLDIQQKRDEMFAKLLLIVLVKANAETTTVLVEDW